MQEQEDMTTRSTISNRVLVRLDPENDEINTKSGLKLHVDTSFEPEKHVVRIGTVEKLPSKLTFKGVGSDIPWHTDIELKVGDKVVMYFLAVQNCLSDEQKCYSKENGVTKIYIKYHNIYAAIREGKIIPVNGYVFVEPVEDPAWVSKIKRAEKLGINIPDLRKPSRKNVTFGKVAYIGNPIKKYFSPHLSDEGYDIEEGDVVVMKRIRDIPVEYEYHAKLDGGRKLFRMQRPDIVAKI